MVIHLLFLLLLSFTDLCISNTTTNKTHDSNQAEYLKLRLLHRNPFSTPSQTLASDSHRISILFSSLQSHKKALKSPLVSGASTGSGQYFVDFRVGTPPQKLLLVADTGSDLVWVKSSACRNCSKHIPGSSYFPRHSSTFSPFHCYDRHCRLVPRPQKRNQQHCNLTRLHSSCRYEYSYADGSRTSGFFSKETITLNTSSGRETKVRNLAFGCGFSVSGPSVSGTSFNGANGVMGLGQGPISFSTQVGKQFGSNKFSYCLMDYTISPPPTSYLMIGKAPNRKPKLSFTPLQSNPLSPTFYYIGIQSVYVDAIKLPIKPSVFAFDEEGNGGTVIDSGTTLSFLVEPAYTQIVKAFKKKLKKMKIITEPALSFDLCFNVTDVDVTKLRLPKLSFRLVGDKKSVFFSPPAENYFIDVIEDVKCLALQPVIPGSGFSVIGNLMQQGYLFEFDRDQSQLGFSRQGCASPSPP